VNIEGVVNPENVENIDNGVNIETKAPLPPAPARPVAAPPPRRPGSVRRTSTVLMHWPAGPGTSLHLEGRARDLLTPFTGAPLVLAEDSMSVVVSPRRAIESITASPHRPELQQLVGATGGGGFRDALVAAVPAERAAGSPLYLLLDDIAACTLIANFVWSLWRPQLVELLATRRGGDAAPAAVNPESDPAVTSEASAKVLDHFHEAARQRKMEGVCAGFRPGASSLAPGGYINVEVGQNVAEVPSIVDPADPAGWHEVPANPAVAMRRARRIDVGLEGDAVWVDAMFRDSSWRPDGVEVAVHEYHLDASASVTDLALTSVVAEPRVLPYPECPAAAPNAVRMVGTPMADLRGRVLESLKGTDGCTHLNDALRSLAEVPCLLADLRS
jgi:hypothetical protein